MLTLRQIEVIRAVMVTGTVGGASRLLNVSSPGISRVMKHAESMLRLKLFARRNGRYIPTPEAKRHLLPDQWRLRQGRGPAISSSERLQRGADTELKIALGAEHRQCHGAARDRRACASVSPICSSTSTSSRSRRRSTICCSARGELVAMSHKHEHPMLTYEPLARGRLLCIVPRGPSARRPPKRHAGRNRQLSADRHRPERSLWPDHGEHLHRARACPMR